MRYYITMWCSEGIECVQDITEYNDWDTANAFAALSGEQPRANPLNSQVNAMRLRARFNSQRNYEIYVFTSTNDLDEDTVKEWANSNPQQFADWAENGFAGLVRKQLPSEPLLIEVVVH